MKKRYEQVGVAVTCRGFEEYVRMFDLSEDELKAGEILDIASGGSSFTADASGLGFKAMAVDPRYALDPAGLFTEAEAEISLSTAKLEGLTDQFDMSYYGNMSNHRAGREKSLGRFAAHYGEPEARARCYAAGSLPALPFADRRFSLVLCSHFLFLYEEQFDFAFHRQAVLEMMRVCRPGGGIRIYPLMSLSGEIYPHLDALLEMIQAEGGKAELFRTGLPFIPGSESGLFIGM
ncbi:methyltransferase domain-containing protein [Paenibacillus sepulcri]|uniref:Class I SAM-dependent methyltransferase n=1 Tax=Paenibacillus sepulcri TaxID=359917 RepID=A0ABS7C4P1_9BACL|nr:class I SAM-dependent methyltransferase [Paenibacillus sepulcri]